MEGSLALSESLLLGESAWIVGGGNQWANILARDAPVAQMSEFYSREAPRGPTRPRPTGLQLVQRPARAKKMQIKPSLLKGDMASPIRVSSIISCLIGPTLCPQIIYF